MKFKTSFACAAMLYASLLSAANQTETLSPILPGSALPFSIQIQQADFTLPSGLQSFVFAFANGKALLIAGRTNGMHDFSNTNDNFPPAFQNTTVYVIDPVLRTVFSRSLADPSSGLTQTQIDYLSVTSPQYYQTDRTLYITGGYGVDTATGLFSTKPVLSAIDIAGLIHWVESPLTNETASEHILQLVDPIFQVTGGAMYQYGENPTLLIMGQNFQGYYVPESNGIYTRQVRRFNIKNDGKTLSINKLNSKPAIPEEIYRRRDLNVVPTLKKEPHGVKPAFVALSGVFTPGEDSGAWTVPVEISFLGKPSMADPRKPGTFKQGMNNYACANLGLFSHKTGDMFIVLLGGITYGYFSGGTFVTDAELPFTNQVTTIKINKHGQYNQYLMEGEYPVIISTGSNPGNQFLFGAGAKFIPALHVDAYFNRIVKLDKIKRPMVVGYIVGGIMSTLLNTQSPSDSAASPYIFTVTVTPK